MIMANKNPKPTTLRERLEFDDIGSQHEDVRECRSAARKLPKMFDDQRRRNFELYYKIGTYVIAQIDACLEQHGSTQRRQAIARLAKQAGLSPHDLMDCARL